MTLNRRTWALASFLVLAGCRWAIGVEDREYRAKNDGGASATSASSTTSNDATGTQSSAATTTSVVTSSTAVTTSGTGASSSSTGGCGDLESSPHNCGACNHDCLGGACVHWGCQPFVVSQTPNAGQEQGLVVDPGPDGNVYWGEFRWGPAIYSAPKSGGAAVPVVSAMQDDGWVADMTTDGTQLFFTNYSDSDTKSSRGVYSVHFDGTGLKQLAGGNVLGTSSLAYNGGFIYFLNVYDARAIQRVPTAGGTVEDILVLPSQNGFAYNMGGIILADDDWVYYVYTDESSPNDTGVYRIGHTGANKQLLYNTPTTGLVGVHNGEVYWREDTGFVWHGPADGTGAPTPIAPSDSPLLFHNGYIYAQRATNIVRYAEGVASPTEEFVAFGSNPWPVTMDAVSLIWVDHYTGTVYRFPF